MKVKVRSKQSVKTPGLPPDSVVYTGRVPAEQPPKLSCITFSTEEIDERCLGSHDELEILRATGRTLWLDVEGVHDPELLKAIGARFNIHPLVLEDIANIEQRPKFQNYGDYLFICLKMLSAPPGAKRTSREQVSLIIGKDYVISFQEGRLGDVFEPVRERLRRGQGILRQRGSDFLGYSLIDIIVDHYFVVMEVLGEALYELEHRTLTSPGRELLPELMDAKREMMFLRRACWPLRDMTQTLMREQTDLVSEATRLYFRDVYDHSVEVLEICEMLRESVGVSIELHLSNLSHQVNEVMKVLTIISTIFMPLSFVAGVYGMNFDFMPELHWRYGYLFALLIMLSILLSLLVFFRKKRWL